MESFIFCLVTFALHGRWSFPWRISLNVSRRRSLSYRNESIDLQNKSMDWFLYDKDLRHERVNKCEGILLKLYFYIVLYVYILLRKILNLEDDAQCTFTAQKMKFSIKDFFSKCDQVYRELRIWSHLLKKPMTENFIFCVVFVGDCSCTCRCETTFSQNKHYLSLRWMFQMFKV